MCAVIFGFMWLNRPSEAELAEQQRIQDSIAAVQAEQQVNNNAPTAMLSPDDVAQLHAVLAERASDSTGRVINDGKVNLTLQADRIAGTVRVGDQEINYDDLLSASADPAHVQAVNLVKQAVEDFAKNGAFAQSLKGTEQLITLRNDSLEIELSTKGGVISRAKLLAYKGVNEPQVQLFTPEDNQYSFTLSNNTQRFETKDFYFTPKQLNDSTVEMTITLDGGSQWGLRYTLVPQSYMVRVEMIQQAMNRIIPLNINSVDFTWHQKIARHEDGKMFEERNS